VTPDRWPWWKVYAFDVQGRQAQLAFRGWFLASLFLLSALSTGGVMPLALALVMATFAFLDTLVWWRVRKHFKNLVEEARRNGQL
jgi:hypothetical protein